jgi:DNA-3-methyladenine glycosylase II
MAIRKIAYANAARAHLKKADPALAKVIDVVGALDLDLRPERFKALARAIVFQQLAGAAANTIFNRFVALYPGMKFPKPADVLATPDAKLRSCGLSEKKALYIKDLARHIQDRRLNFHRFHLMTDEEVIADLTQVKGIGIWTAQMFLMFNLGRPDVFPADDLGVMNGMRRVYAMRSRPKRDHAMKIAERWRPFRSAAAIYLWRSLEIVLPDGSPPTVRRQTPRSTSKR